MIFPFIFLPMSEGSKLSDLRERGGLRELGDLRERRA